MIQQFSVENFLSYGDKQTISFEASSDKSYIDELTVDFDGVKLLKVAMIYGANASGKTNLLFAIQTLWSLLYRPKNEKEKSVIRQYMPFALRRDRPTKFEIIFWANRIKYSYSIEFDEFAVIEEKLDYHPSGRRALFYERNRENGISFGATLGLTAATERALKDNTLYNHTVLSTFAKINIDQKETSIEFLFDWINDCVHEITRHSSLMDIIQETQSDKKMKDFFESCFLRSDFNIVDFRIVKKKREIPQGFVDTVNEDSELSDKIKKELLNPVKKEMEFIHKTDQENFSLSEKYESAGTLRSISMYRKLYDIINTDCIYMIDEIEEELHFDLVKHFLLEHVRNSSTMSQLIFTTHNQMLLDEDFVRRDMVWFAEKSRSTSMTELFSAADFGLHKNVSLFNFYKIGKLGAKPELGSTLIY